MAIALPNLLAAFLNNLGTIDSEIKTRQARNSDRDCFAAYVVVTLICGTADDNPLFDKIYSRDNLRESLLKLVTHRERAIA